MEHFQENPADRQPVEQFTTELPSRPTWQVGQRVLALWPPELSFWYPAVIQAINGDKFQVDYDDGGDAELRPQQLMPLDIGVGSRIWCRWKAGAVYYPGKVDQQEGERLHVAYDDSDTEWTTVSLMRVQRCLRVRIADAEVAVRQSADLDAPVIAGLGLGEEIEVSRSFRMDGREWVEISLADGRRGFLPGASRVQPFRQRLLWEAEATLFTAPTAEADPKGQLLAGEAFYCLDEVHQDGQPWLKIRDARGTEAFLSGRVRMGSLGEAPPSWVGSVFAGMFIALIVCGVGALKGGFRVWQMITAGRILDLLGMLLMCLVSAAAAGVVHHVLTSWRRHPVGRGLSWMLVILTFLFSLAGCLLLAASLAPDRFGEGLNDMTHDPWFLLIFSGIAIVVGMFFGYSEQNKYHALENQGHSLGSIVLPLVATVGMAGIVGGLLYLWMGARDWPWAFEAQAQAQELTAEQLQQKGYGNNRHVHLKEFQFCKDQMVEKATKVDNFSVQDVWTPVVPGKGANLLDPQPEVPKRVRIVVARRDLKTGNRLVNGPGLGRALLQARMRRDKEEEGYRGMVTNGVKTLPATVRQQLQELAPDTDLTEVILLDNHVQPIPPQQVEQCFWVGGFGLGIGLFVVVVANSLSRGLVPTARLQPVAASSLCQAN